MMNGARSRLVALAQGGYFTFCGLWPWLHYESFAWVTQVQGAAIGFRAVGLLMTAGGVTLLGAARTVRPDRSARVLGLALAVAVAAVDLDMMRAGIIGRLNGLDVLLQASFVIAWLKS